MKCPSRETLSNLVDNSLPWITRKKLRRHIAGCSSCSQRLAEEIALKEKIMSSFSAAAPVALRTRVLDGLELPRSNNALPRRIIISMAVVTAALFSTFLITRPVLVPKPAFAQVEAAMRELKTAQWEQEHSLFDARSKNTRSFVNRYAAQLDPPLYRGFYGDSKGQVRSVKGLRGEQVRNIRIWSWAYRDGSFMTPLSITEPRAALQHFILEQITAPSSSGRGRAAWQSSEAELDGKKMLRFEAKIEDRLAREKRPSSSGSRRIIWADPETKRIVRTQTEFYSGQRHDVLICKNFRYDKALPEDTFEK
jgi:hypothetical protein